MLGGEVIQQILKGMDIELVAQNLGTSGSHTREIGYFCLEVKQG